MQKIPIFILSAEIYETHKYGLQPLLAEMLYWNVYDLVSLSFLYSQFSIKHIWGDLWPCFQIFM